MTVVYIRTAIDKIRGRIFTTIKNLEQLPAVSVTREDDYSKIYVTNNYQYVPDFHLAWCNVKNHYRVYIKIVPGKGEYVKDFTGYPIMNIGNGLIASAFNTMYQTLNRYRPAKLDTEVL